VTVKVAAEPVRTARQTRMAVSRKGPPRDVASATASFNVAKSTAAKFTNRNGQPTSGRHPHRRGVRVEEDGAPEPLLSVWEPLSSQTANVRPATPRRQSGETRAHRRPDRPLDGFAASLNRRSLPNLGPQSANKRAKLGNKPGTRRPSEPAGGATDGASANRSTSSRRTK
jgi:hypothetical protein